MNTTEISKPRVTKDPEADKMFAELYDRVGRLSGSIEQSGDTVTIYIGEYGSVNYWQLDTSTNTLSLYLNSTLIGKGNG